MRKKVGTFRSELMDGIERRLNIGTLPNQDPQIWTFEKPVQEVGSWQSVLLRVQGPGMVHAGVDHDGQWLRIYGVPLKEVSSGLWEALLLDPEVNALTFIWYDPNRSGNVHWEGKNYYLQRRIAGRKDISITSPLDVRK